MIYQELYISKYDWLVHIYYAVTCYWTDEIMMRLYDTGCPKNKLNDSYHNLMSCKLDTGITYSNYRNRETVMVVGLTSSPAQFINSLDHERKHLEAHIAQAMNIDPWGEEIAYLSGEIAENLISYIKMFVCDCECHKKEREDLCTKRKKKE